VTGIDVTADPTDMSYVEGQTLDLTGMTVTLSYNDSTTVTGVTPSQFASNGITASPANGESLTVASNDGSSITVSCNSLSDTTTGMFERCCQSGQRNQCDIRSDENGIYRRSELEFERHFRNVDV
jgi:hypothetical protein